MIGTVCSVGLDSQPNQAAISTLAREQRVAWRSRLGFRTGVEKLILLWLLCDLFKCGVTLLSLCCSAVGEGDDPSTMPTPPVVFLERLRTVVPEAFALTFDGCVGCHDKSRRISP